jgi:hypothetical protein
MNATQIIETVATAAVESMRETGKVGSVRRAFGKFSRDYAFKWCLADDARKDVTLVEASIAYAVENGWITVDPAGQGFITGAK